MTQQQREKLQYITGVLNGLSYLLESNAAADALCDIVEDLDKLMHDDKEDE